MLALITPDRVNVPLVLAGSTQLAPTRVTVIVRVPPPLTVEEVQVPVNPLTKDTVGEAMLENPDGNVAVMVPAAASAPPEVLVTSSVHGVVAPPAALSVEKATAAGRVRITTGEAGLASAVSALVFTMKLVARMLPPVVGLPTPAMVRVALVLTGSEQPAGSVMVTVVLLVLADGLLQVPLKPVASVTVGEAGTVKVLANCTVTVPPAATDPVLVLRNPTVQVSVAASSRVVAVKETAVT